MTAPNKEEALRFINDNRSFFMAALNDQQQFHDFYADLGQLDALSNYSKKLRSLFYKHQTTIASTTTAISVKTPVFYTWLKGDFKPALEHEEIRAFLLAPINQPLLMLWRNHHSVQIKEFRHFVNKLASVIEVYDLENNPIVVQSARQLQAAMERQITRVLQCDLTEMQFFQACERILLSYDFSSFEQNSKDDSIRRLFYIQIRNLYNLCDWQQVTYNATNSIFSPPDNEQQLATLKSCCQAFCLSPSSDYAELKKLYRAIRNVINGHTPYLVQCFTLLNAWHNYVDDLLLSRTNSIDDSALAQENLIKLNLFITKIASLVSDIRFDFSDKTVEFDENDLNSRELDEDPFNEYELTRQNSL